MTSRRPDILERASNHSAFGFCLMNYCWKQRICREYGARCGFGAVFFHRNIPLTPNIQSFHPKHRRNKMAKQNNHLWTLCFLLPSTFVTIFVTGLLLELLFFRFVLRLDPRWERVNYILSLKASWIHSNKKASYSDRYIVTLNACHNG